MLNENLTEYQKETLSYRKNNLTHREIAKLRGCSCQAVGEILRKIKTKCNFEGKI